MMKRWSERYGAQLVGVSGDVVEMRVASPPTTQEAAIALANEEFLYCEDIVTQGTESISALGATLLNGSAWYFWWTDVLLGNDTAPTSTTRVEVVR